MRFTTLLPITIASTTILAVAQTATNSASAALASASMLAALPACAPPCIEAALVVSGCSLLDLTCICTNNAFNCAVGPCEQAKCSAAELGQLIPYVSNLCFAATNGSFRGCNGSAVGSPGVGNSTGNGSTVTSPTPTPSVFTGQGVLKDANLGLFVVTVLMGLAVIYV